MQLTGTEAFARRPIGTLSGGERQKVFIAAALAQEAGMLFLDEPTTFLDYYHRRAVLDLLDALRRDGITLLTVTHDLDQALARSDRVLALRGGEPVFLGTPQDLLDGGHLEEIFATRFLVLEHPVNGRPVVVPDGERR
jgi:iron complex transport system ATP-binding protein